MLDISREDFMLINNSILSIAGYDKVVYDCDFGE